MAKAGKPHSFAGEVIGPVLVTAQPREAFYDAGRPSWSRKYYHPSRGPDIPNMYPPRWADPFWGVYPFLSSE